MNKFNKKHLLLFILICFIGFIFPFFTKTKGESLNSTLSVSFTIVSTLVMIITLIVAAILFDKYGFNAKFRERQLDTVLSLIDQLKLLNLAVSAGQLTYYNYIRNCIDLEGGKIDEYNADKTKTLLVPYNFNELLKPLHSLYSSSWLPSEIKEKMNFLYIFASKDVEDFDYSKYVKLDINSMGVEPWVITIPKFTFEQFSIDLTELSIITLKWISQHSRIKVDFDLIRESINK